MKKTTFKFTRRILALLLVCCLCMIPFPFATAEEEVPATDPEANEPTEATVVEEVSDSRGEFEKHYLCSDGNYIALSYPGAVHYQEEDGWKDIDNRLFFDEKTKSYRNANNPSFPASFSTTAEADLLRLDGFSYSVSAYAGKEALPLDGNALAAPTVENGKEESPIGKPANDPNSFNLPFVNSKITYSGLFAEGKADLEYVVSQNKVKENIILREGSPIDRITYTVTTDDEAQVQEDGSVIFYNEGEKTYTIGVPYLYDSGEGEPCYNIGVKVEEAEGTVLVSYTLDKEWMDQAVYPVVFDPAVTDEPYCFNTDDTYIEEYETRDFSGMNYMRVGRDSGQICKAIIRINNLPTISLFPIIGATLSLTTTSTPASYLLGYCFSINECPYTGSMSDATYLNIPSAGTRVNSYILNYQSTTINVLTPFLMSKCNGSQITYCIQCEEVGSNYIYSTMMLASADHATLERRPVLSIIYGYNTPTQFTATNTNEPERRYFLTNTSPIGSGCQLLKTSDSGGISMSTYSQGEVRGHFAFIPTENGSVKILGCYDMLYLRVYMPSSFIPQNGNSVGCDDFLPSEWLLIQLSNGYFLIVLRQNPELALTRTNSGIKVITLGNNNSNQYWRIYSTSSVGQTDGHNIDNDIYYINNYTTRTFLVRNAASTGLAAGKEENLQDKMKWEIKFIGNGQYMLRSIEQPTEYLHVSSSGVSTASISGNTVPDAAVFSIQYSTNGSYTLRSAAGRYLSGNTSGLTAATSVSNNAKWRLCKESEYEEYDISEIQDTYVMRTGSSLSFDFDKTFTDPADFTITVSNSSIATVSGYTIHAVSPGTVTCTLTHKPTGQGKAVTIIVHSYSLQIHSYLDQGYQVRFSDAFSKVNSYHNTVKQILAQLFDLDMSYTVNSYTSLADNCKLDTYGNISLYTTKMPCNHTGCLNYHPGAQRDSLRDKFCSDVGIGTENTKKSIWTGHILQGNPASCSNSVRHCIVVTPKNMVNEDYDNLLPPDVANQSKFTLLHETSHQLGAPDHYCYDMNSNNCNNPTNDCWRCDHNDLLAPPECLMTTRILDLEDRLINGTLEGLYCGQCMSASHDMGILKHLIEYHAD